VLPSDTYREPVPSNTAVLLASVTYLLTLPRKTFTCVIRRRLEPITEQVIGEYHAGYIYYETYPENVGHTVWSYSRYAQISDRPKAILTEKSYRKQCSIFIYQLKSLHC
jgi:hypothetical protein